MPINQNQQGNISELQFQLEAWKHNLIVSRPFCHKQKYDFITDDNNEHLYRIQVKSVLHLKNKPNGQPNGYRMQISPPHKRHPYYSKNQIDFFALYVIPKDVWYIVPIRVIPQKQTIQVYPDNNQTKYNQYKNAWFLLKLDKNYFKKQSFLVSTHTK